LVSEAAALFGPGRAAVLLASGAAARRPPGRLDAHLQHHQFCWSRGPSCEDAYGISFISSSLRGTPGTLNGRNAELHDDAGLRGVCQLDYDASIQNKESCTTCSTSASTSTRTVASN
jgi:hypothetical protein